MFETSKKIAEILSSYGPLMAIATKISPIVASQKTTFPFLNYVLSELPIYSKEQKLEYTLTLSCWAEDYDTTLLMADEAKNALYADENIVFFYQGSNPIFSEEGIFYTESKYQFKI